MKREVRKLLDKIARNNQMNARAQRKFRRTFPKFYRTQTEAIRGALIAHVGKPINDETKAAMIDSMIAVLPEPRRPMKWVESAVVENEMLKVRLTEEAARFLLFPAHDGPTGVAG